MRDDMASRVAFLNGGESSTAQGQRAVMGGVTDKKGSSFFDLCSIVDNVFQGHQYYMTDRFASPGAERK